MPYPLVLTPDKLDHRYWTRVWEGATVFIIGGGPSASKEALREVNKFAYANSCPVVVVNTQFMAARWSDVLFFSNRQWWSRYQLPARRGFDGSIVSVVNASDPKVMVFRNQKFPLYGNSGADAISFAHFLGAKRAVLLGFDGPQADPVRALPRVEGIHSPAPSTWPQAMAAVNTAVAKTLEIMSVSDGYGCFRHVPLETLLNPDFELCPELHKEMFRRLHSSKPVVRHAISPQPKPLTKKILTAEDVRLAGWRERWKGKTAFVLASGPSLVQPDVDRVKTYAQDNNCPVVVTNTTFRLAPWADLLFFHDKKWWQVHGQEVEKDFYGVCATMSQVSNDKVLSLQGKGFNAYRNSGGGAINFAILAGAKRIILLGLDGKYASDGRRHWHKQHPSLGDAISLPRFVKYFPNLAKDAQTQGVEILNATRDTALTCFTRVYLEDVLSFPPQPYAE